MSAIERALRGHAKSRRTGAAHAAAGDVFARVSLQVLLAAAGTPARNTLRQLRRAAAALCDAARRCGTDAETAAVGVRLLERHWLRRRVRVFGWRAGVAGCLLLASKLCERPLRIAAVAARLAAGDAALLGPELEPNALAVQALLLEREVCRVVRFQLDVPTAHAYARRAVNVFVSQRRPPWRTAARELTATARRVLDAAAAHSHTGLLCDARTVAAAALVVAGAALPAVAAASPPADWIAFSAVPADDVAEALRLVAEAHAGDERRAVWRDAPAVLRQFDAQTPSALARALDDERARERRECSKRAAAESAKRRAAKGGSKRKRRRSPEPPPPPPKLGAAAGGDRAR